MPDVLVCLFFLKNKKMLESICTNKNFLKLEMLVCCLAKAGGEGGISFLKSPSISSKEELRPLQRSFLLCIHDNSMAVSHYPTFSTVCTIPLSVLGGHSALLSINTYPITSC